MIGFQRVGLKRGVSSCGQWLEICSLTIRKIVRDLGHSLPDFALPKENPPPPARLNQGQLFPVSRTAIVERPVRCGQRRLERSDTPLHRSARPPRHRDESIKVSYSKSCSAVLSLCNPSKTQISSERVKP